MPWKASSTMSERLRFIARVEEGEGISDLAREFGISEKTAYKFLARWKAHGVRGLEDRSHAVDRMAHRTPGEIVELVLALRRENPTWGGRMLKARLERKHPGLRFPSATSIAYWLKKNGLVRPQRPRRRNFPVAATLLTTATAPNHVWATDFKGEFRLGNNSYCYPLTATDLASRYILGCEGLEGTGGEPVWDVFEWLFDEHGLPDIIRSDNGSPFASRGLAGLTWLSARWIRLGIKHERIEPSHPEQNGQHERMHRTLKQATTRPAGKNLFQQQERFDNFTEDFNQERPHQALGMRPPADFYRNSERKYRGLPELEYPLADDVMLVRAPGLIIFSKHAKCYLTEALVGQRVGIREIDDCKWLITFATIDLGIYDERDRRFEPLDPEAEGTNLGISNGVGDAGAIPVDSSAEGPAHRAAPPPEHAPPPIGIGEDRPEKGPDAG
jgi:transposase InsO family protein